MKNILVLSYSNSTKHDTAAFNRFIVLLKGLKEYGHQVELLFLSSPLNGTPKYGMIEGVNYKFISSNFLKDNRYLKYLFDFILILKFIKYYNNYNKLLKFDYVFLPLENPIHNKLIITYLKKFNVKLVHERSEFPDLNLEIKSLKGFIRRMHYKFYMNYIINQIDILIVISNTLRNFYLKYVKKNCEIYLLPMIVDHNRFSNINEKPLTFKYIAYCGILNSQKDGVDILVSAFALLSKEFEHIKLLLIGNYKDEKDKFLINSIVEKEMISNKILVIKQLSRDQIPSYLIGAEVLCLARPKSRQAEGGFPTKLGEYLSTGKPVVATDVGEISVYLEDEVNIFLAKPGSVDSFYLKLKAALTKDDRFLIAEKGKKIAEITFNGIIQGKIFGKYLDDNIF